MLGPARSEKLLIAALLLALPVALAEDVDARPSAPTAEELNEKLFGAKSRFGRPSVLRHLSQDPRLNPPLDRVEVLQRMGRYRMRPATLLWHGDGPRLSDRFRLPDVSLIESPHRTLPSHVADPETWGPAQERWLFAALNQNCTCGAFVGPPGFVPWLDAARGATGGVDLQWDAGCAPSAADYAVFSGTLGNWYDHTIVTCTTGGATSADVGATPGDRYFLIVPLTSVEEGSYGLDSDGFERPRGIATCRAQADVGGCP